MRGLWGNRVLRIFAWAMNSFFATALALSMVTLPLTTVALPLAVIGYYFVTILIAKIP